MGRPVWVYLDLLGADADTELAFMCKAYEEADHQQLDKSRNGQGHNQTAFAALQHDWSSLSSCMHAEYTLLMCVSHHLPSH